jgi:ketosteroid isomerase-like protein
MSVSDNIETVRRFYAGPAADDAHRVPMFAPDAIWHVPGDNPVSGEYRGIEAITRTMVGRMQPLDEWRIEVRDVMGNADHVVGVVHLTGSRYGATIDTPGAHVFRFNSEGEIVEAWGFTSDQARLDDFFRATPAED